LGQLNILVIDVAASTSGAMTVLMQKYQEFAKDSLNTYFICVSIPELEPCDNIKVINFPWVKKSWLHRLWFDFVTGFRLIKKHQIDRVVSLQNIGLWFSTVPQTIYLHQSLPYVDYHFTITKDPQLWVCQNIIHMFIKHSLRKADIVITQTNTMRSRVSEKDGIPLEKFVIENPNVILPSVQSDLSLKCDNAFFYPATAQSYKNHKVLFQSLEYLYQKDICNYTLFLTVTLEELSDYCKQVYLRIKENIILVGYVDKERMVQLYSNTILLFPSYIESYPMPLAEAKLLNRRIIAADCDFSREILAGYDKVEYFNPFDALGLANLIMKYAD
jgi:glycosyltransferase involved in cell wall biosynthesis